MGKRVLVVEDDPDNLRVVETVLRIEGHEVVTATNGLEALERLETVRPDLILLDLKLPQLDGWETTRRIKAREELRGVPVIAFSAMALKGDEDRARKAGCDDYVSKPCPPRTLRAKLRKWL